MEGKIKAIEYVRKNKIPFLGLCLGMQLAVVEFARNVCRLKGAYSTEFSDSTFCKKTKKDNCQVPVINVMADQKEKIIQKKYGGTMRLGAYSCELIPGARSRKAYAKSLISERHRHRYELDNQFREILKKNGLVIAGINPERDLVEIIEIKNHPFFVATQFHPELKSRPLTPHPLFREFIKSCLK